jgi:hypothetical protein
MTLPLGPQWAGCTGHDSGHTWECSWGYEIYLDIYIYLEIVGYIWIYLDIFGDSWIYLEIVGYIWIYLDIFAITV